MNKFILVAVLFISGCQSPLIIRALPSPTGNSKDCIQGKQITCEWSTR